MAFVSDSGLPDMGTQWILSIGRSIWISRPAAGCNGFNSHQARYSAGASYCFLQAGNFPKEMSSTGGIHPLEEEFELIVQTITYGYL